MQDGVSQEEVRRRREVGCEQTRDGGGVLYKLRERGDDSGGEGNDQERMLEGVMSAMHTTNRKGQRKAKRKKAFGTHDNLEAEIACHQAQF